MKIYEKKQKQKIITLILCIIMLILICAVAFYQQSLSYETKYNIITSSRTYNPDIINNIQINEMNCAYDSKTNTWFFPQDLKDEGSNVLMKTGVISDSYNVSFVTDKTINGIGDNYYNIDFENKIKILVYTDEYYYETNLQFTGLPIINIKTEQEITEEDSIVYSEIIDPYFDERDSEQYIVSNANMHIRGGTSRDLEKKGYKYELIKSNSENKKKKLLGMREDDDWVLDALYFDPTNIRNVISCDLWNEMNSLNTTNNYNIDLECEFVEVFINNKYAGIYVLKEPIDKKQVGIEDNDEISVLIKGNGYISEYISEESYKHIIPELRTAYIIYEMEYPKNVDDEKIISDFTYFLDKVNPYFDKNKNLTFDYLKDNFNINSIVDYSILVNVTKGLDNLTTKNIFFYLDKTGKIVFIPWDLDMTWGLTYSIEKLNPVTQSTYVFDYENVEEVCTMYYDNSDLEEYNKLVYNRYSELRNSVFSYEHIEELCNGYKTLLIKSGAYTRDNGLYYKYDLEKEIDDMLVWYKNRVKYLDNISNEIKK